MLLALVIAVASIAYSWFNNNNKAKTNSDGASIQGCSVGVCFRYGAVAPATDEDIIAPLCPLRFMAEQGGCMRYFGRLEGVWKNILRKKYIF